MLGDKIPHRSCPECNKESLIDAGEGEWTRTFLCVKCGYQFSEYLSQEISDKYHAKMRKKFAVTDSRRKL